MNDLVILPDDPQAATYAQLNGWVSRGGLYFGNDERTARWSGATHVRCSACEAVIPKQGYTLCDTCREKREAERFSQRETKPWDGTQMVYDESTTRFFSDPDEAFEWADDEGVPHDQLRLVLCDPVYCRLLDDDFFTDDLPEDGDVPDDVAEAIAAFNAAVKNIVLAWQPGKYALAQEQEPSDD